MKGDLGPKFIFKAVDEPRVETDNPQLKEMSVNPDLLYKKLRAADYDRHESGEIEDQLANNPQLVEYIQDYLENKGIACDDEELKRMTKDRYLLGEIELEFNHLMRTDIYLQLLAQHEEIKGLDTAKALYGEEGEEIFRILKEEVVKDGDITDMVSLKARAVSLSRKIENRRSKNPTSVSSVTAEDVLEMAEAGGADVDEGGKIKSRRKKMDLGTLQVNIQERLRPANLALAIAEVFKKYKEVKNIIDVDRLTGGYSREGLREQFELAYAELQSAPAEGEKKKNRDGQDVREFECMALLVFDLDRFKEINTKGHDIGDKVLKKVIEVLLSQNGVSGGPEGKGKGLRATDIVGRQSGDEFTVILKGVKYQVLESAIENQDDKTIQRLKEEAAATMISDLVNRKVVSRVDSIEIPNEQSGKSVEKGEVKMSGGVRIVNPGDKERWEKEKAQYAELSGDLDGEERTFYEVMASEADDCGITQKELGGSSVAIYSQQHQDQILQYLSRPELREKWARAKVEHFYSRRESEILKEIENCRKGTTAERLAKEDLEDLRRIKEREVIVEQRKLARRYEKIRQLARGGV